MGVGARERQARLQAIPGFVATNCSGTHPFDKLRTGFIRPMARSVALFVQGNSGSD
jgi:hypothetical protein